MSRVLSVASLAILLTASSGCGGDGSSRLSTAWPEWQRIEASEPPSEWQIEEASPAFDAWQASVVVTQLVVSRDATTIRFDGGDGDALEVHLPALSSGRFVPAMVEGDTVEVTLIRRQGFEGVAQGLTVLDRAGRLLLLYDDGGYGPAFYEDDARAGLTVGRTLLETGARDGWASLDVTFELGGDSVVLAEGRTARLGATDLAVRVVVSRQWIGPPMTDVDLSPLAYLVFRSEE